MKQEEIFKSVAKVVSEKTGLNIREDHVHVSERRFYYIQELKPGYAYCLHHYRGPYFVEVNRKDMEKMEKEETSVEDFVNSTQWLYGYFWGSGSMISGGYYTPLEKKTGINDKDLIGRVMASIAKVGASYSSGSPLTDGEKEEWDRIKETYLNDPRADFFKKADELIHSRYGYNLRGFLCDDLPENEMMLFNNSSSRTFELFLSEENIWNLLIGKEILKPEEMKVIVGKSFSSKKMEVKSPEDFINVLFCLEITRDWEEQEAIRSCSSTTHSPSDENSLLYRIFKMLRKN